MGRSELEESGVLEHLGTPAVVSPHRGTGPTFSAAPPPLERDRSGQTRSEVLLGAEPGAEVHLLEGESRGDESTQNSAPPLGPFPQLSGLPGILPRGVHSFLHALTLPARVGVPGRISGMRVNTHFPD